MSRYKHQNFFKVRLGEVFYFLCLDDYYSKTWVHNHCDYGRMHEGNVLAILKESLGDAVCFVDVGAHLGYYSLFAYNVMNSGVVYAFEMDAVNFDLLEKNVCLNNCKHIHLLNVAVSNDDNGLRYERRSSRPSPELCPMHHSNTTSAVKVRSVKTISLDHFFKNRAVCPDVVKIDVEGYELKVLEGMDALISTYSIDLFIEIHPEGLRKFDSSVQEVLAFLCMHGYCVYEIVDMRKHSDEVRMRVLTSDSQLGTNSMVFATKNER